MSKKSSILLELLCKALKEINDWTIDNLDISWLEDHNKPDAISRVANSGSRAIVDHSNTNGKISDLLKRIET